MMILAVHPWRGLLRPGELFGGVGEEGGTHTRATAVWGKLEPLGPRRPLNLGKADGGTRAIAVRRKLELGETGPARPRSHCGTWGRQMAALGRLPCAGG